MGIEPAPNISRAVFNSGGIACQIMIDYELKFAWG
jgi:hypothetical protein